MNVLQTSPVLRSRAKTGKAKFWQLKLLTNGRDFFIIKSWWQENSAPQSSTPERIEGKNVGRSNATSDQQQAELAFTRAVQKRRDKGFSEDGSAAHVYIKPMLAHSFADHATSLKWPVFVQPKLDGFRMLMDGENAWTRGGKDHVRECVEHLMWDTGDLIVDGELLLPGNKPLQVTASAAKKCSAASKTLEYWVYDIVDPKLPFSERTRLVHKLLAEGVPKNVKLVPTLPAQDEGDVMKAHAIFLQYGYEGTIIRTANGLYEVGYRSHGLLKLKDFQDAEFKVVGVEHGKGSFADKAILVLEVPCSNCNKRLGGPSTLCTICGGTGALPGVTFNAVPQGDATYREGLWTDRDKLIGQWWTVRYQSLSNSGRPVFPVAIAPRGKEDQS